MIQQQINFKATGDIITIPDEQPVNFKKRRKEKKKTLGFVEKAVRECFDFYPNFRDIKATNQLIRYIWNNFGDYSADSITRIARKLRASGEYDTNYNQNHRANEETAMREFLKN